MNVMNVMKWDRTRRTLRKEVVAGGENLFPPLAALITQHSTLNTQHSTLNTQHSTLICRFPTEYDEVYKHHHTHCNCFCQAAMSACCRQFSECRQAAVCFTQKCIEYSQCQET